MHGPLTTLFLSLSKSRIYRLSWEYSETLPWIIVADGARKVVVTYFKKGFRCSPVSMDGLVHGFLQPLNVNATRRGALLAIKTYFQHGYDAALMLELNNRVADSKKNPGIPAEEVFRKLRRRLSRVSRRKGKPRFMEIPPSCTLAPDIPSIPFHV